MIPVPAGRPTDAAPPPTQGEDTAPGKRVCLVDEWRRR